MGIYSDIDKGIFKGWLPGGSTPQTSKPSTPTDVPPTKSTTPNIQPTPPSMTITLPSGSKVTTTPVQTSPSTGGGGYVAPNPSGGSQGGGGVSVSYPQSVSNQTPSNISNNQINQIVSSAKQEQITQQVSQLNQAQSNIKNINTMLGIQSQSKYSDVFNPVNQIKSLENKRQSVITPSSGSIDIAVNKGRVSPNTGVLAQSAVSRDILSRDYQYNANLESEKIKNEINQNLNLNNQVLQNKAQDKLNYWQDQVNNGLDIEKAKSGYENDIKELNKENDKYVCGLNELAKEKLDKFNKDYFAGKGKDLSSSEVRRVTEKSIQYNNQLKDIYKKAGKEALTSFGISAGTMGIFSAIGKVGGEFAVPATLGVLGTREIAKGNYLAGASDIGMGAFSLASKSVQAYATPLIAITGLTLAEGEFAYNSIKEYNRLRDLGFDKGKAKNLALQQSAGQFTPEVAGLGGAVLCMVGVQKIFNSYAKSNINQQKLIEEGFTKNPDILKVYPKKGIVIEKELIIKDPSTGERLKVNAGTIARVSEIKVDPTGQRPEVERAFNKISPKGEIMTLSVINSKGDIVQTSLAKTSIKQGYLKPLKETQIENMLIGKSSESQESIRGVRFTKYTDISKGQLERLSPVKFKGSPLERQPVKLKEELALFESRGKVAYGKQENSLFRGEVSKTKDISIFRRSFNKEGSIIEKEPKLTESKSKYISELRRVNVRVPEIKEEGLRLFDTNKIYRSKVYEDIAGKVNSNRFRSLFNFNKVPNKMKTFKEEKLIENKPTESIFENKVIKPSDIAKSREDILFLEKSPKEFNELNIPSDTLGVFKEIKFSNLPEKKNLIAVKKGEGISEQATERKVLHELTHVETKSLFNEGIERQMPYSQRPSELVAQEMEKLVGMKGEIILPNMKQEPIEVLNTNKQESSLTSGESLLLEKRQELKLDKDNRFLISDKAPQNLLKEQASSLFDAKIKLNTVTRLPKSKVQIVKPIERENIKSRTSQNLFELESEKEKVKTKRLYSPTNTSPSIKSSSGLMSSQSQVSILESPQVQKQDLGLMNVQIQPLINPNVNLNQPNIKPNFGSPFMGSLEIGGGQKGKGSKGSILGKSQYNPSLGSVLLKLPKQKVTKKQAKELSKKTYSGLELRRELEIVEPKGEGLFTKKMKKSKSK